MFLSRFGLLTCDNFHPRRVIRPAVRRRDYTGSALSWAHEPVQIGSDTRFRAPANKQVADDRDRGGSDAEDVRRRVERDAADRNRRNVVWSRALNRVSHQIEPYRIVTGIFRRRSEYRPDGDIRQRLSHGSVDLIDRVRRQTNEAGLAQNHSSRSRLKVVLSKMHSVGSRETGDVGAIVDDDGRASGVAQIDYRARDLEELCTGRALRSNLQQARSARQIGRRQRRQLPARARRDFSIEDGAKNRDWGLWMRDWRFRMWNSGPVTPLPPGVPIAAGPGSVP
jgi:hypothetical protein